MGDPFFDLGNFSINHELTPDEDEILLAALRRRGPARPARPADAHADRVRLPRGDVGRPPAGRQHARRRLRRVRRRQLRAAAANAASPRFERALREVTGRAGPPRTRPDALVDRWDTPRPTPDPAGRRRLRSDDERRPTADAARRPSRRPNRQLGRRAGVFDRDRTSGPDRSRRDLRSVRRRSSRRSSCWAASRRWSAGRAVVAPTGRRGAVDRPSVATAVPSPTASVADGRLASGGVAGSAPASADPSGDPVLVGAGDIADCGLDGDTRHGGAGRRHPGHRVHGRRQRLPGRDGRTSSATATTRPGARIWRPHATGARQPRLGARRTSPATSATSGRRRPRPGRAGTRTTSGRGTSSSSTRTARRSAAADRVRRRVDGWPPTSRHRRRAARSRSGITRGSAPACTATTPRSRRSGRRSTTPGPTSSSTATTTTTSGSRRRTPTAARTARAASASSWSGPAARSCEPFPNPAPTASCALRPIRRHPARPPSGVLRLAVHPDLGRASATPGTGPATDVSCRSMSADQARVVVIGGGITGCSVAYHLALAGWTDVAARREGAADGRIDLPGGRPRDRVQPVVDDDGVPPLQHRAVPAARRLRDGRQPAPGIEPGAAPRARADGQPGPRDRARRRASSAPARRAALMPAISPESLYGAVHLAGDGHLDPHGATHAVADAARALGVRIRTGRARDRVRAVGPPRGHGRPDRRRPDRHRDRRQRRRDLGAAGRGDGRRRRSRRRRSTTSTSRSRPCPGHELPRDMPCFRDPDNLVYGKSEHGGMVFGGYETRSGLALGGRRPVGARGAVAAARLRAVRAADGRGHPALPVPRRRRGDPARLPPGRDDARRQSAAGAAPRGSRVLGRGRAVAQRVRGRRRDRSGDGRLDHGRRPGRGHRAVSRVAVRRHLSRPGLRGRAGARDLLGLLPAALSVRRGPRRPAAAAVRAPRPAPGGRRGVRHEGRLGAGRPTRAGCGRGVAPGATRRPTAGRKPPWFERVLAEGRAVRERAGIIDLSSFGKIAVEGPGALGLLQRVERQRHRPPGRERRLHAVVRRARRDRGGRDGHASRRRSLPCRDRRRIPRVRDGLAATHVAEADGTVDIRDVSGELATIGLWGPRARDILAAATRRRRRRRCHPAAPGTIHPRRTGAGPGGPHQLRGRARLGTDDRGRLGGRRLGRAHCGRQGGRARAVRLPGPRRAADGEGLPLLRDRPDDARHARRGGSRRLRPTRGGAVHRSRGARRGAGGAPGRTGAPAPDARHRRRRLPAGLRRRGRPPRRRGRRAPAQRRLRADRRADDRLRVPAGRAGRGRPARDRRLRPAGHRRSSRPDVLVDPRGERMRG